jgi:cob(I)alamin adenosyltransferase
MTKKDGKELPTWHREEGELGKVHVYTGDGKGKTTAALGLALRAAGHGRKVLVVQFMKGDIEYGELRAAKNVPGITIVQFGRPEFVDKKAPAPEDIEGARKALAFAREAMAKKECDVLILDEVNVAVDFGLVGAKEVLEVLRSRPGGIEVVLTGRDAPKEFIEHADLVTEMRKVKHPYDKGLKCREGIEY